MNIEQWYQETVGNDSQNTVADNAGIVPSSLYRQLPDKLSPQNVVKIARAYGGSAIDGLVAVGLIDDDDLRKSESSLTLFVMPQMRSSFMSWQSDWQQEQQSGILDGMSLS